MKGDTPFWRGAALLAIGAIVGLVPGTVVSYFQARAQVKHMIIDRRIGALKDYSAACARVVGANQRVIEIQVVYAGMKQRQLAGERRPALEEWLLRQLGAIWEELGSANVAHSVQRDIANALFSATLTEERVVDESFRKPQSIEEAQARWPEIVKILAEGLPKIREQCRANTGFLASRLFE